MRRQILIAWVGSLIIIASASAAARTKPDFAGVWVLDKSKSEGLPPDMEQTMTVTQDVDTLSIQTKIVAKEDTQTLNDSYVVDRQNKEFVPQGPNGMKGRGVRTIKWLSEGMAFQIDEESTFDTPTGPVGGRILRKWSLSEDRMILTIESTFKGPRGETQTKRIFVREQSDN